MDLNKKENYEDIRNEIEVIKKKMKEMYMIMNMKEDDIKNIINEKDMIINYLNERISKQEKIIFKNKNEISSLNQQIKQLNSIFTEELNKKENKIILLEDRLSNIQDYLLKEIDNKYNQLNIDNKDIKKKLQNKINKNDNYINLKLLIEEKDINTDIIFLRQFKSYKYNFNFEPGDIDIVIDDENIPPTYKSSYENEDKKEPDAPKNIYNELNQKFKFYWNFSKIGMHNIKIIFNKVLNNCEEMFLLCNNLIEVDCSHFNCSKLTSCKKMFSGCSSLTKINFGKNTFSFCSTFESMFDGCSKIEYIDVSNFDTKNSLSFKNMFSSCSNLKKVDISKFNSSKCENIIGMFYKCQEITEIDMINWNLSNIKNQKNDFMFNPFLLFPNLGIGAKINPLGLIGGAVIGVPLITNGLFNTKFGMEESEEISGIDRLFYGCTKLKYIKMKTNFKKINKINQTNAFNDISENGTFILKKGFECNDILNKIPLKWNILIN